MNYIENDTFNPSEFNNRIPDNTSTAIKEITIIVGIAITIAIVYDTVIRPELERMNAHQSE